MSFKFELFFLCNQFLLVLDFLDIVLALDYFLFELANLLIFALD